MLESCNINSDNGDVETSNFLEAELLQQYKKTLFLKSASTMLGKPLAVNGIVEEVYKNTDNEIVIYLKGNDIPVRINCTLTNSDSQIKEPIKLGQTINLEGMFTQINSQMFLKGCRLRSF